MTLDAHVLRADQPIGAAVFLTDRLAVTADHCLRFLKDDELFVTLRLASGAPLEARVLERRREIDMALLRSEVRVSNFELRASQAVLGSEWFGSYRPRNSEPTLTGDIAAIEESFTCANGGQVEVLQLHVDQELGSYHGYSGSAVRSNYGAAGDAVGMLFEQYPDRVERQKSSNVLFATPISALVRTFTDLQPQAVMSQLMKLIGAEPSAADHALPDISERATQTLALLKRWSEDQLLDTAVLPQLQARVAEALIHDTFGKGS